MAITTIDDKHLTNIATAIRQKRGIEDTFKPSDMAEAIKDISGGEPILEDLEVSPTTSEQVITAHQGYDGINQITIAPVTNSIDDDIRPENIKKGVEILGVVGNIEDRPAEPVLQNKSVEPSTGKQIITADSGYDGLGQVTVNEVTNSIDSNIKADNIKQGVSILGVQGTLEQGAEVVKKYRPKYVSFYNNNVEDLTEETQMLDTSLITSMYQMFGNATSFVLKKIDVSEWDTSNVENMSYMFYNNSSLEELGNIGNWDTSKVNTMTYMFRACTKLVSLDLSKWKTPKVTNTSYMFQNCTQLQYLDVSNFSNEILTNAEYMFNNCSRLQELRLDNFNTSKITKMGNMFASCSSLKILDLSNFDTSNVTSMSSMFTQCKALEKLDIRNFTFGKVQYTNSMFSYVPANCLIIVKSDIEKTKVLSIRSDLTNVKTLAEYQAEGGV